MDDKNKTAALAILKDEVRKELQRQLEVWRGAARKGKPEENVGASIEVEQVERALKCIDAAIALLQQK